MLKANTLTGFSVRNIAPFAGALDYRVGARGAAGTILLYSAYTGHALRVRNQDSAVESDIDFGHNSGVLNDAQLLAALNGSASPLAIVKVYAQDGSGNDYVQATTSKQPLLTQDGPNSGWCMVFDGVDDWLKATIASTVQPFSRYIVWNPTVWGNFKYIMDAPSGDVSPFVQTGGSTNDTEIYAGVALQFVNFLPTAWYVATQVFNGATSALRKNKTTALTGDAGTGSANTAITIGARGDGSSPASIKVMAMFLYTAADDTAAQNLVIDAIATAAGVSV